MNYSSFLLIVYVLLEYVEFSLRLINILFRSFIQIILLSLIFILKEEVEEARRKQEEAAAAALAAAATPKHHHVTENENDDNDEMINGHESQDLDTDMDIIDPVEERRTLAERNERLQDQLKVILIMFQLILY